MVENIKLYQLKIFFYAFLSAASLVLSACPLPSYYNDFDSRFSYRDTFIFLNPSARALVLEDEYSFIVLTDTHITNESDAEDVAKLKGHIRDAKFVVITGDITDHGKREEIQAFINAANTLVVPCFPVIGNHDIYTDRGAAWKELIGSTCYRIDAPDSSTTLFILDSANASFGHEQNTWLEREMRSAKKHVFIFTHENFYFIETGKNHQTTDFRERARIMSLLKHHADAMFMGHIHTKSVKKFGGVDYIINESFKEKKAYCRVHVSNEGIRYEF
jgi:predicted phosphodiesterase